MTRSLLAVALALAIGGPVAQAAPARTVPPQIVDPKGDTPVGALDILTGAVSSPGGRYGEKLFVRLTLAEAPSALPAEYWFGFQTGCVVVDLHLSWTGAGTGGSATMDRASCRSLPTPDSTPVTYRIEGATVTFEVPLDRRIKRGNRMTRMSASAMPVSGRNDTGAGQYAAPPGDIGSSLVTYEIGSERRPAKRVPKTRPGRPRPVAPQVTDTKGDAPDASLDIVSATVSSPGGRHGEKLLLSLTLAEPPGPTPARYLVDFGTDCAWHEVYLGWTGEPNDSTARSGVRSCASGPFGSPYATVPADYRIEGTTIVFELPLRDDLVLGQELWGIGAQAWIGAGDTYLGMQLGEAGTPTGDVGYSHNTRYVIGSERTSR